MNFYMTSILLVSAALLLVSGFPAEEAELQYLEDCTDPCFRVPTAQCQVKCVRIVNGEGQDCINRFVVNDDTVICEE